MRERSSLITNRRELHAYPELSGKEGETCARIISMMQKYKPDAVFTKIGGHSLAFVFDSKNPGPTILFRAELDALPIQEINTFDHTSTKIGIAHLCGHDGHMTILLGLAERIFENKPALGKVILFFQSAEETGQGARLAVKDPFFSSHKLDFAFALHNLPGFKTGQIVVRDHAFSSASVGMTIELNGKTSHAGYPENGKNPAIAVANIIVKFDELSKSNEFSDQGTFITIVQIDLGEEAFGTSAGKAIVRATLRSPDNHRFKELIKQAEESVHFHAKNEGLTSIVSYHEEFHATENDPYCNTIVRRAAKLLNYNVLDIDTPFRWSEDFSWFTNTFRACLFGVGSGVAHAQLHNPDYDFPDEIIEPAANLFYKILEEVQKFHHLEISKTNINP